MDDHSLARDYFWIIMRLTEETKNIIIAAVRRHFSQAEKIILFGSRVNDSKRGGDIDILVQTPISAFKCPLRVLCYE